MKTQTFTQKNALRTLSLFGLFMILTVVVSPISAQENLRTVSGVITDETGPLPYAAVVLKGTSIGTSTDEDGKFTFPKPLKENDVLVVIHIGYKNFETTIGKDTTFLEINLDDYAIILVGALRMGNNNTIKDVNEN